MIETICQVAIMIFGCSSIWLISRKESWRRWGFILGLLGQPFWIYTSYIHAQWGVFALSFWFTYCWGSGVYNFWYKDT